MLFLVILMPDGFLVLLALFLSFDLFIFSCIRVLLIWGFGYHEDIFLGEEGVCLFSTVVNFL